jgi:opacity protein-like surface antigen
MKTLPIILSAIILSLLVVPTASAAETEELKNYTVLRLGVYSPQHDDMNHFDEGFNGEVFYGRRYGQHFAAEIGLGYFKTSGDDTLDASVKVIDILYNAKGVLPFGPIEFYAGPGIGVYFAKVNVSPGGGSDMSTAFGYHVVAGGNFNITRTIFLGIEGKYFWSKTNESIIPGGGAFGSHLDGATATVSMGYRWLSLLNQ